MHRFCPMHFIYKIFYYIFYINDIFYISNYTIPKIRKLDIAMEFQVYIEKLYKIGLLFMYFKPTTTLIARHQEKIVCFLQKLCFLHSLLCNALPL